MTVSELRIAFVCTGNRFRSPIAAALLVRETRNLPVRIASLGTLDLGRERALPEAVAIADSMGLDIVGHRARSLGRVDLDGFHLVLGFERKHVMASVVEADALIEHTFTLPELVELLAQLPDTPQASEPVQRAVARIHQAHANRPPDFRDSFPEVADPLGMTVPAQRETAREIEVLVGELSALLFR